MQYKKEMTVAEVGGRLGITRASEKSRLKSRLRELDADAVSVLARNKDKTHRYRATLDGLAALTDHLIPSGASAMREESIAGTFMKSMWMNPSRTAGRRWQRSPWISWAHWQPANAAPENASSTNCSMPEAELDAAVEPAEGRETFGGFSVEGMELSWKPVTMTPLQCRFALWPVEATAGIDRRPRGPLHPVRRPFLRRPIRGVRAGAA
ncbi:hypothetical protein ABIE37_002907 [Arthrobacter bambusae]|uniref:Uncharacterized protein n=1 Tax=Arthrobacter bambusae TaxID=1338426 RepID=A0ABV2P8L8_9MICC